MFEDIEDREPTPAERSEMNRQLRAFPDQKKIRFLRKICPGSRIAIQRDFALIDTSKHPKFEIFNLD